MPGSFFLGQTKVPSSRSMEATEGGRGGPSTRGMSESESQRQDHMPDLTQWQHAQRFEYLTRQTGAAPGMDSPVKSPVRRGGTLPVPDDPEDEVLYEDMGGPSGRPSAMVSDRGARSCEEKIGPVPNPVPEPPQGVMDMLSPAVATGTGAGRSMQAGAAAGNGSILNGLPGRPSPSAAIAVPGSGYRSTAQTPAAVHANGLATWVPRELLAASLPRTHPGCYLGCAACRGVNRGRSPPPGRSPMLLPVPLAFSQSGMGVSFLSLQVSQTRARCG